MRSLPILCLFLCWGCSTNSIRTVGAVCQETLLPADPPAAEPAIQEPSAAASTEDAEVAEARHQADWGMAVVLRMAEVPFVDSESRVKTLIPLLYYEGERFFMRGLEGGAHLWKEGELEINAIGRLRFVDVSEDLRDDVQPDTADIGVQIHRDVDRAWWEAEVLSDRFGNWSAVGSIGATYVDKDWVIKPTFDVRYGSANYVSRYYGLDEITDISAEADIIAAPSVTGRYRLFSDLYLIGSVRYNVLGSEIRGLPTVDASATWESFVGIGIFQDRSSPQYAGRPVERSGEEREIGLVPHVRVGQAWGTPSSLKDVLAGDIINDEFDNQLTSIFYGYPVTDRLFGAPLDVYISPGLAYHYPSAVQEETIEAILKLQLYWTIRWPIRWRLGLGEGLSWIEDPTYIERTALAENGDEPSRLMNYLDASVDLNMGDLVGASGLEALWFGVMLHHRSAIFEISSQFGGSKGGSNYVGFYLLWDIN